MDVALIDVSISHRVGSTKQRPIIVRFTRHNTKVAVLSRRRVPKERKSPFNVQEDLTICLLACLLISSELELH